MPRIQVYKGNGSIIPVDKAKKSTGFQCPWTGKIFGAKKSYVNHLKTIRQDRIYRQIRNRRHQLILDEFNNQIGFEAIMRWVELHPEFFFDIGLKSAWATDHNRLEKIRKDFWIKITHLDVSYSDMVSNSHSCPRGGVTCWSSHEAKDGRPRGYPGWHGRIEFEVSHDIRFGIDVFRGTGIHTGTGGSTNGKTYGYDVKFFESDWPGLNKARVWSELGGPSVNRFQAGSKNYFRW